MNSHNLFLGNSKVTYYELNSIYGHDTFLLDINNVGAAIKVCRTQLLLQVLMLYFVIFFRVICTAS